MNVFFDGLRTVEPNAATLTFLLFMTAWGQVISNGVLARLFKERLTDSDRLSLSMAAWVLPVGIWAGIVVLSRMVFGEISAKVLASFFFIAPLFFTVVPLKQKPAPIWLLLFLFCATSMIFRLAFLQKAVFPSYFDSAEHYHLIRLLAEIGSLPQGGNYYHMGYHVICAAFVIVFDLNILDVMLVFGQVVLALLPLSLFFIVRRVTASDSAALFTVLLAAFGFHMPAHLLNWGKYPALLSLPAIHFSIAMIFISRRNGRFDIVPVMLAGLGILAAGLIHTRSVIFFFICIAAGFFTLWQSRLNRALQKFLFLPVIFLIVMEIFYSRQNPVFAPLFERYIKTDIWILILIAALTFFALRFFPAVSFFLFTAVSFLFPALFIPISLPAYGLQTALDRPYVQMTLYLPLAMLGGLGLAGFLDRIHRLTPDRKLPARLTALSIFGLVVVNASLRHEFYPSDCCQLVTRDDLAAIAWMDENLPPSAKVLIASTGLYVTTLESTAARNGVDAGIWITPITAIQTTRAWDGFSPNQESSLAILCKKKVSHIYLGRLPQSFQVSLLNSQPEWYRPIFSLPAAQVYQVIGCD